MAETTSNTATHLSADSLAELRTLLERERAEVLAEAAAEEVHDADLADDPGTRLSEREEVEAISALQQAQLAHIDEALARIEDGTYGTCQDCQVEIPFERLEAMPTAAYCVNCQARHVG